MTTRSTIKLADGRELNYYDAAPGAGREAYADRRRLPARPPAAQLRYDALRDEWVAVAAARQGRPLLPSTQHCPLCPTTDDNPTEIPAPSYEVAVFENRFPSFGGTIADGAVDDPLSPRRPATGRCEVVCFTPDHDASFARLEPARVRVVLDALADRVSCLSDMDDVEYLFCFENRGEEIGVTLHHPHGQIYGYPFVPPVAAQLLNAARSHRERTGANLFAEVLAAERAEGTRVVASNDRWTAFVPVAARWPFEVHLYPHERFADLAELPDDYRDAFGEVYLDVLRRFDCLFGSPLPYISGWYQAPVRADRDLAHTHLRLFSIRRAPSKLKYLAGSESAMGAFVNDVAPEEAARLLREAE
ncbi:MAG TPA: galactose-1-phosphate uridylyltransferase [Stackebrandtia sp.]|uniref:galactose-1-phosphate uridylyltransferase n=1 Tax=Stackebrandtia sp. TaxID=2023065 RepID=UPI002D5241AC|nr:galactose-1-phosphate uridylyltransferase [Stackebrandtia sp.]HZE38954.1 galactose-1-phosphate uridylyltransferase [Stackebrandtia sp.]